MLEPDWYTWTAFSDYPFVETNVPSDIVVDLFLEVDHTDTGRARLLSLSVTKGVVSVVLGLDGVPVAAWNGSPVPGNVYALSTLAKNARGTIVFGQGITDSALAYTASVGGSDGFILASAWRSRPPGISSVSVDGRPTKLHGNIAIDVQSPLAGAIQTVGGQQALVIQPENPLNMADFRTRCGGRVESGTCGDTPAVQQVGPGIASCDGTLTISLAGPITAQPYGPGIILLASSIQASDICGTDFVPYTDGSLPGDAPYILYGTGFGVIIDDFGNPLVYN